MYVDIFLTILATVVASSKGFIYVHQCSTVQNLSGSLNFLSLENFCVFLQLHCISNQMHSLKSKYGYFIHSFVVYIRIISIHVTRSISVIFESYIGPQFNPENICKDIFF